MDPEQALARIVHCLDRAHVGGFKTKAWTGALARVRETDPAELARAGGRAATSKQAARHRRRRRPRSSPRRWPARCPSLPGEARGRDGRADHAGRRSDPRRACGATATATPPGATAARRSRRWPRTARDLGHEYLVLTDHSPRLTIAHGLNRERLLTQLGEIAALNETLAPFRILTGHGGRHPRGRHARPRRRPAGAARRGGRQRPLEAAIGAPEDDRAHGAGGGQPARRHPGPLHRAAHRQAPAVGVRRRLRVRRLRPVRHRGRDQLPAGAAGPAARSCSTRRSSTAATSRSTPTPTPPASSSGSRTAATGPPTGASRSSGSSTPGPWTTCWRGSASP